MALTFATYARCRAVVATAARRGGRCGRADRAELPRRHQNRAADPNPGRLHANCARRGRRGHRRCSQARPAPLSALGRARRCTAFCSRPGLLFFAFAGYARIATIGEEVRDPARTIPRAIIIALAIAVSVYLVVGVAALLAAGSERLAHGGSAAGRGGARRRCCAAGARGGASAARWPALGALLALIAGIGRTTLAMARHHDLPGWLAAVHPRYRVPHHAEIALAVVVCVLAATSTCAG